MIFLLKYILFITDTASELTCSSLTIYQISSLYYRMNTTKNIFSKQINLQRSDKQVHLRTELAYVHHQV